MYSWALIFGITGSWGGAGGRGFAMEDIGFYYFLGFGLVHPIFDYLINNFYWSVEVLNQALYISLLFLMKSGRA